MLSIYNFLKVKLCYRTYWKQWLAFLTMFFLVFACSNDDSSNNVNFNNDKLVDTIQFSYTYNDPEAFNFGDLREGSVLYSYAGNKLLNMTIIDESGNITNNFTYNEDNLISAVYYWNGDVAEFEYDNQGRISAYTYTQENDPFPQIMTEMSNFEYNQDGSVVETRQIGDLTTVTYSFDHNGNMTTAIYSSPSGDAQLNFTYDNKNNPFKNILSNGFFINKFIDFLCMPLTIKNNTITAGNENNIFFYTYDDDYPISINSPNGFINISNIQINITYTN